MQTIIKNIHISPKKSRRILIKKLFGSLTESIRRDKFKHEKQDKSGNKRRKPAKKERK